MKNVMAAFSPRTIRVLYTVAAFLVLILTLSNALNILFFRATSNDQCGWLARQKGERSRDHAGCPRRRDGRGWCQERDILHAINGIKFSDGQEAMRSSTKSNCTTMLST